MKVLTQATLRELEQALEYITAFRPAGGESVASPWSFTWHGTQITRANNLTDLKVQSIMLLTAEIAARQMGAVEEGL